VIDIDPGRILYDEGCAACHKAGGYDTDGFAPNLAGNGDKLEADLTRITGSHQAIPEPPGPSLSSQELTDLRTFLDALVP
jgi:mono/diheme cytochrome c family protein